MCGIYKITNTINGRCYIGQSIDIITRWRHHRSYPLSSSHYPLYRAFDKYGLANFNFEIIEECQPSELDAKECAYIKIFNSYLDGYNQTSGGSTGGHIVKLSNEDVEIIYDLLINSSISQNEIAKMFNVGPDTISEINQGKTRIKENCNYPLRNNRRPYYCKDCGKKISYGAVRCSECSSKQARIVQERPDRETLKHLIRTKPFTQIANLYGITDNSIRKWCDAEGLPRKKSDINKISDIEWEQI